MGMRLRIFLTSEEERTLWELQNASGVPQRVKNRAQVVRMNARGDHVEQIKEFMKLSRQTVCKILRRWQNEGLAGLFEAKGRGRPRRWQEEDMEFIEKILGEEERTYTSAQLSKKLFKERKVNLHPDYIRQLLKKRG
jgi:transposase